VIFPAATVNFTLQILPDKHQGLIGEEFIEDFVISAHVWMSSIPVC
jgi:hypothetical protein